MRWRGYAFDLRQHRTARGRADAKAKGVKFGRKRIDAGEPQRSIARSYNVSQATISRL